MSPEGCRPEQRKSSCPEEKQITCFQDQRGIPRTKLEGPLSPYNSNFSPRATASSNSFHKMNQDKLMRQTTSFRAQLLRCYFLYYFCTADNDVSRPAAQIFHIAFLLRTMTFRAQLLPHSSVYYFNYHLLLPTTGIDFSSPGAQT